LPLRQGKTQQTITNDNKPEQTATNIPKEKEKEKENKNKNEEKGVKFTPPTVEQVAEFCRGRENGIDPEYFCAYYGKQNWYLSNGRKMSDWKAAVITWERKDRGKPSKRVAAQEYAQRDYSGVQRDLVAEQNREMEEWLQRGSA
jgi:hypothetical protein